MMYYFNIFIEICFIWLQIERVLSVLPYNLFTLLGAKVQRIFHIDKLYGDFISKICKEALKSYLYGGNCYIKHLFFAKKY